MKLIDSCVVTTIGILGGAFLGAFLGCQPLSNRGAYQGSLGQDGGSYVEIRTDSDFYASLSAYGRWQTVGSYGRCWFPGQVAAGWSPYSNGYWQQTDAGWYWASDEPWAWATYHYGRWDSSPQLGWYWVPQTQWAPAWVEWREGGGYIGWAPRGMAGRNLDRRAYVFVQERHFTEPIRRSDSLANRSAFDRTTTIRDSRSGNRGVGGDGPSSAAIERAGGRKQQMIMVRQLRHQEEMKVIIKHPTPETTRQKDVSPRSRNQPESARPVNAPRPMARPAGPALDSKQGRALKPEQRKPEAKKEIRPAVQPGRVAKPDERQRGPQQKAGEKVRPNIGPPHVQPTPNAQRARSIHQAPVRQDPRKMPPHVDQKTKPATGQPAAPSKSKDDEKKDQADQGK